MTLVKIKLDGDKVIQTAYADETLRAAGDAVDDFLVVDIAQSQEEIDAMQPAVGDGAVKLTDQETQDFEILDKEATDDDPAVTHIDTRLVSGTLTVAAGWKQKPKFTSIPNTQDMINANLTKQLAALTKKSDTAQAAVVALTKQLAAQAKEEK